jgi:hypothetical protein
MLLKAVWNILHLEGNVKRSHCCFSIAIPNTLILLTATCNPTIKKELCVLTATVVTWSCRSVALYLCVISCFPKCINQLVFVTEILCAFCKMWTQFSINLQKNSMRRGVPQHITPPLNQEHNSALCRTLPCCRQVCVFSVTNEGPPFLVRREDAHLGWQGSPLFIPCLFVTGIQVEFQKRATWNFKKPIPPLTR